jgi:hypothetical protein
MENNTLPSEKLNFNQLDWLKRSKYIKKKAMKQNFTALVN